VKVKFVKKNGSEFTQDLSYEQLLLKVISIVNDGGSPRAYSLSSFLKDPMSCSVGHTNYQRTNYSDGYFEYREL
jgi:hypothetical protein